MFFNWRQTPFIISGLDRQEYSANLLRESAGKKILMATIGLVWGGIIKAISPTAPINAWLVLDSTVFLDGAIDAVNYILKPTEVNVPLAPTSLQ